MSKHDGDKPGVPGESHGVAWLKANGFKLTRKNWLELNYLGNPPSELGPEEEMEIPMDELIDDRVIDISTRKPLEE